MGLFFLLAAMAPTALAGAMEVGATRFAAGEYARAVDAPRLRLRPPADYRAKPPQKRYRSEEHTSEIQSLMRITYAVFCLKKKTQPNREHKKTTIQHS